MTILLASGCKPSNCFQQGFNHPTPLSFVVGLVIVVLLIAGARKLFG